MKVYLKYLCVFSLLSLVGCGTNQLKPDAKFNQIAANINGNYLSLYEDNDSFQCGLNNHLESLLNRIEDFKSVDINTGIHYDKKRILVSIHGGLNTINHNIDRVNKHYDEAVNDGYYPVFIGWRSGAATTLNDRYFRVRDGVDRTGFWTAVSSPLYMASDILKGIGSIPESFWGQGSNFYDTHKKNFTDFDEQDIGEYEKEYEGERFYYTGKGDDKGFWASLGYTARQVFPGVARLITTPLAEGGASEAWNMMERRAKTLIYRQGDLSYRGRGRNIEGDLATIKCEEDSPYFKKGGPNGVVAQLIRALESINGELEVTLVGHSMGAIIANDILGEFPDLNYKTVVHMASADSIRNLMNKTVPVLKANKKNGKDTQFYNLSLHPTNEEQEAMMWGAAPEGSLLMWLDHLLMDPETTLDRRSGRWDNIKWAFPFFKHESYMHFKLFGLRNSYEYSTEYQSRTDMDADQTEPLIHGDFGDYKFWREEFYWKK